MQDDLTKYDDQEDTPNLAAAEGTGTPEEVNDPADGSEAQVTEEAMADVKERAETEDMEANDDDSTAAPGYSEES